MKSHKRNVTAMHTATRNKVAFLLQHVGLVIEKMREDNLDITFHRIAIVAKVSKAWLYRQPKLREKIELLRNEKKSISHLSRESKKAITNLLKFKIAKLEKENKELRQQLEIVYGELHRK